MIDLIGPELDFFLACQDRIEAAIESQRAYLQTRAEEGKLSQAYLNQMNYLLGAMSEYMEAVEKLHNQLGLAASLYADWHNENQRLKMRVGDLQEEVDRLRYYCRNLGGDLTLVPFIRRSDYQYA